MQTRFLGVTTLAIAALVLTGCSSGPLMPEADADGAYTIDASNGGTISVADSYETVVEKSAGSVDVCATPGTEVEFTDAADFSLPDNNASKSGVDYHDDGTATLTLPSGTDNLIVSFHVNDGEGWIGFDLSQTYC